MEWSAWLHGRFDTAERSPCAHQIKGCMGPRAGVTVTIWWRKKSLDLVGNWTPPLPVTRLSTHTLATTSITLLGVGRTVEDITCHSLAWILKQVPGVTGVVFLWGAELSCLDGSASAINLAGLIFEIACRPRYPPCYMYYVRTQRDSGAVCSSPTGVT
jgi:hypothetical protein